MADDSEWRWEDNGGGGRARRPHFSISVFVYILWKLSTEIAVNSIWISTLVQFFITLGYKGRTLERIFNKKKN